MKVKPDRGSILLAYFGVQNYQNLSTEQHTQSVRKCLIDIFYIVLFLIAVGTHSSTVITQNPLTFKTMPHALIQQVQ